MEVAQFIGGWLVIALGSAVLLVFIVDGLWYVVSKSIDLVTYVAAHMRVRHRELQRQNSIMLEALEWYADESNHIFCPDEPGADRGQLARDTLAKVKSDGASE
jgi:hypothetical protein